MVSGLWNFFLYASVIKEISNFVLKNSTDSISVIFFLCLLVIRILYLTFVSDNVKVVAVLPYVLAQEKIKTLV